MLQITSKHSSLRCYMYSFTYIQVLKLHTGSTVRDVSCRTYRRFHATLTACTGIQTVSSQSCCAAALEKQVTSLAVHVWQLAPPTASSSVLLTTSQRQTMSTRSSSVKRCLPNASSSVDHVPKSFSLRGQRSYVELLRGGGRAWGRG